MDESIDRSCTGKIKYNNEVEANIKIRHMISNGIIKKWEIHSYKCKYCDSYHIGHADKNTQNFVKNIVKSKKPLSPIIKLKNAKKKS